MTLTVEDGTGKADAESYASVATADTHWQGRPNRTQGVAWVAASLASKEGALREATAFLDAVYGPYYRGTTRSSQQRLLWPRSEALDDAGFPLPALPPVLAAATCELAGRAIAGELAEDADRGGQIKRLREKVAVVEQETEYTDGAPAHSRYGYVGGMLAPILTGAQPGAPRTNVWHFT